MVDETQRISDPCPVVFVSDQQHCRRCNAWWDAHDWDGRCALTPPPAEKHEALGRRIKAALKRFGCDPSRIQGW